jgi:hypothetical protein
MFLVLSFVLSVGVQSGPSFGKDTPKIQPLIFPTYSFVLALTF